MDQGIQLTRFFAYRRVQAARIRLFCYMLVSCFLSVFVEDLLPEINVYKELFSADCLAKLLIRA